MVTDSQIDDAILAASDSRWLKVAAVVFDAAKSLGSGLPEGQERHDIVAERLRALVEQGRLTAVGDVRRWRQSEVCLP